jgi:hypothetical protein
MPTDLVKFIELLYAVVVGFAFGEISKSEAFKKLISGRLNFLEGVNNFALIAALMIFVVSDYTVYEWAANHGGGFKTESLYKGKTGALMFFIDVMLLSVIYFLSTIACLEISPRRLNSFLILFVGWHVLVTVWWILDGLGSGHGPFYSLPIPHVIRASLYLLILCVYRIAVHKNIGGLRTEFETDQVNHEAGFVLSTAVIVVALIIGIASFVRFIEFHRRMFAK